MSIRSVVGICVLVVGICGSASATTRYVSHTGSNTPPYTSWSTAAQQVAVAARAASTGDTIRVGSGTFVEADTIFLGNGVSLIGSGADSTTIELPAQQDYQVWCQDGNHLVQALQFKGNGTDWQMAIYAQDRVDDTLRVTNCHFDHYDICVISARHFTEVSQCEFMQCGFPNGPAVWLDWGAGNARVNNNTFRNTAGRSTEAVRFEWMFNGGRAEARNNLFLSSQLAIVSSALPDTLTIANNVFYSDRSTTWGPSTGSYLGIYGQSVRIVNNLFRANFPAEDGNLIYMNVDGGGAAVSNNIFLTNQAPLRIDGYSFDPTFYRADIAYNDFYLTGRPPCLRFQDTGYSDSFYLADTMFIDTLHTVRPDTILFHNNNGLDPMLVDSSTYYLQAGSPCINGGDPTILDVDGSRSDIGLLGGPYGSFYTYVDYVPATPKNFGGNGVGNYLSLHWAKNGEADLSHYVLFRSQGSPVPRDSGHVRAYFHVQSPGIRKLSYLDTLPITFIDSTVVLHRNYYYTLVSRPRDILHK